MTVKERLHKLVDELSELEADDALRILIARHKNGTGETDGTAESNGAVIKAKKRRRLSFSGIGASDASGEDEPVVVGLPESWETFEDGTPQPNWTALIRADRDSGH